MGVYCIPALKGEAFKRKSNGGHDVDRKILELLVIPRRSGEISEAIGLSKPAVVKRLKKLESLGLIRKTGKEAHVKYFIPSPP